MSHGGLDGGFALYVRDGKLTYAYNRHGRVTLFAGTHALRPGRHRVELAFELEAPAEPGHPEGPAARVRLTVDGQPAGDGCVDASAGSIARNRPFAIGFHVGEPVIPTVEPPHRFGGTIGRITVVLLGEPATS